jgi:peptidoglycan/LPS O-acetylase OafA/YrhL
MSAACSAIGASPAGVAVECFYVISGFFISLVLNEKYTAPDDIWAFYGKRFLRIFSLYWLFAIVALSEALICDLSGAGGPLAVLIDNADRLGPAGLAFVFWTNIGIFFRISGCSCDWETTVWSGRRIFARTPRQYSR